MDAVKTTKVVATAVVDKVAIPVLQTGVPVAIDGIAWACKAAWWLGSKVVDAGVAIHSGLQVSDADRVKALEEELKNLKAKK